MITELLDLADRLDIPTPRSFEPMQVHYVIDLSKQGEILDIGPAYGSYKNNDKQPQLGKVMECPVYFPLKLQEDTSEVQASGGGGFSVPEAGHGDVREIFCTEIRTPQGNPPKLETMKPSNGQTESEATTGGGTTGKNQYYRHQSWLKQLSEFIESTSYRDLDISRALRKFVANKHRLTNANILELFSLPEPDKVGVEASSPQEQKKAKDAATKQRAAQLRKIANSRFTFRIDGELLLKNQNFRQWWEKSYADKRNKILKVLPEGVDGFSNRTDDGSTRLTPVFPHIPLVPGGGSYCPLASFDKRPTRSYGLGKHTLAMSLTTSERVSAALKRLLQDGNSRCALGKDLVAIFWAVPPEDGATPCAHDFTAWLDEPDALQVRDFFRNIHGHSATAPDIARFYCAILSSPKSRITVRSWQTDTLRVVTKCAEKYFGAVSLPSPLQSNPTKTSTLDDMAWATIAKSKKQKTTPAPTAYSTLLQTALFGKRLPHSFLESTLSRQRLELATGHPKNDEEDFESRLRHRIALLKLYFKTNKDITMDETNHETQNHPAYLCGRVLALMDKIHNVAHKNSTASSPAGRYYGSASSTPALVFPRLCKLANIHLDKIGGGLAHKLQHGVPKEKAHSDTPVDQDFEGLADLIARFSADARWPRTLSLEDQGRFAIGFYYEKCRRWPRYRKGQNPGGNESDSGENLTNDTNS